MNEPDTPMPMNEGYAPDPDDPGTPEARAARAAVDVRALLVACGQTTIALTLALVLVDVVTDLRFTLVVGFGVGAGLATVNLWLLSSAFLAYLRSGSFGISSVVALFGSVTTLVLVSAFLVLFHPSWIAGFALGFMVPAPAGMWYARRLGR